MNDSQKQAIKQFFDAVELLKEAGVIRSDVVFGDIGEFLCTELFQGLSLVEERTNEGFDGYLNCNKVQIKYSNSPDAKNIDLGDPEKYQILIVVLGKNSAHRRDNEPDADYLFYKYESLDVTTRFKTNSGYKLSKSKHYKNADKQYLFFTTEN